MNHITKACVLGICLMGASSAMGAPHYSNCVKKKSETKPEAIQNCTVNVTRWIGSVPKGLKCLRSSNRARCILKPGYCWVKREYCSRNKWKK